MALLCTKSSSGLLTFTISHCVLLPAVLLGKSQVLVSAAAVHHHVEGRDATYDATRSSSTDHTALSLIRREVDVKKSHQSNAAESDRAQIVDALAPGQRANRGAWWFWPEPEPHPLPAPAPAPVPASGPVIEKQLSVQSNRAQIVDALAPGQTANRGSWWFWPEPAPHPLPAPAPAPSVEKLAPVVEKRLSIQHWPDFVDKRHMDETATAGERAFFESLETEIKKAWFLHGQSVIIMIANRPYLVSPDSHAPVTHPRTLENVLGQGENSANPEFVARRAYTKNVAELVIWVPDVKSLTALVKDFSIETMVSLQQDRNLRGFWKGEEHSSRHVDKMRSSDFVKLGLSTMWLRGGPLRENIMKKALLSALSGGSL